MKKLFLIALSVCCMAVYASAQKTKKVPGEEVVMQADSLHKHEMELQAIGDSMIDGSIQLVRIKALTQFIPAFVKTLKFKGSYSYPFDSLKFMKKLSSPDDKFRIYNWVLKYDDGTYRYYGAIQMNRTDSLKLIPLRDFSEKIDSGADMMTLGSDDWFGALYYEIIHTRYKRNDYYTLLGWDGDKYNTDKKIIDVLTFSGSKPVFGAPIFDVKGKIQNRVFFEFSGNAVMLLNYIPEHNIITFDHLVPPNPGGEGFTYTYVPDGTYDYFIYKKGKWIWEEELFDKYKNGLKQAGD